MDRRKMLALLGVSPALVAGGPAYGRTTPASHPEDGISASGRILTVLNPGVTAELAKRVPLTARLDTLDGKTIYLVDFDWGGMGQNDGFLQEMQAWFTEHIPKVKTIIKLKKGNFVTDDPALWKEIADNKGDGVFLGVAG
ncbi:MAG TPA: hypothetical protein VMD77_14895 [Candidatus Baltobacteraceae bacterium]|jgi:hypothetical protein|nr:hypothetical protein [Candidatus Baltobacteraceae bacterium]